MRRLGISVVAHITAFLFLFLIFAVFDFDITVLPRWVLPLTFVLGGITWDIIDEVDKGV